jgi:type IV secretion system protein VirB6
MGFFATFNLWLNGILTGYIGTNTARIATLLTPMAIALSTLYVMVWGLLQLFGKIDEPLIAGLKRIIVLVVVLGAGLHLWLYNTVIVDSVFNAPGQLAAGVIGAYDPVGIIDQILLQGGDAANLLIQKGGILNGNFSYYLAGFFVYLIVGLTAIYVMFLLALSRIALSVLLAVGPLFIILVLFETTKRFFEAWIAQLANYALITILTVLVAALMIGIVSSSAQQAANQGGGITIADAVRVCLASGLTFLVMRQVLPMAAGLASGLSLSSFGLISAALTWGFARATRTSGRFLTRAVPDKQSAYAGMRRLAAGWRENTIQAGRP